MTKRKVDVSIIYKKMKNILKGVHLKSPDDMLEGLKNWFSDTKKLALIVALIVGFITHIVLFSVIILSPDGLWNALHYSAGELETTSGRWAINLIDTLRKSGLARFSKNADGINV